MTLNRRATLPRPTFARGLRAGGIAGFILLAAECVASIALGGSPTAPPRLAGSAILGPGALSPIFPYPGPVVVGACVYVILGALTGGLFGQILGRGRYALGIPTMVAVGASYGGLAWIVAGMLVGPFLFPPLAAFDFFWQGFVVHVVFFGAVLGAILALREQR